ncbi:BAG family molecular chaperone regulator 1-like [Apostichopus japonicus]|uniref:BAG family molecular chaperone regulator 1-like n=1 Tax=Stichopus japonicus TaxID=307972 RepID=UPI003AB5C222
MGEETIRDTIFVILAHGPQRYNLQVSASESKDVCVSDLKETAYQVLGIPPENQKIIHKGKQLSDPKRPLYAYGVTSGSRLMVMGSKNSRPKDPRQQEIEAVKKNAAKVEQKQNEVVQELEGIEKGFLESALVQEALQKLERRLASCSEEFLKLLESLDSLSLADGPEILRNSRKTTVQHIQRLLDSNDSLKSRIAQRKLEDR